MRVGRGVSWFTEDPGPWENKSPGSFVYPLTTFCTHQTGRCKLTPTVGGYGRV